MTISNDRFLKVAKSKITPASKFTYLILCSRCVDAKVDIHYSDLTEFTGLSRNTIASNIKELLDKGHIKCIGRGRYLIT